MNQHDLAREALIAAGRRDLILSLLAGMTTLWILLALI